VLTPEEEETIEVYKPEFKKLSGLTVVVRLIFRRREKETRSLSTGKYRWESDFRRRKKRKRITKEKNRFL